jgi:pimeloyl-ACP methyl ester carboxylesterase
VSTAQGLPAEYPEFASLAEAAAELGLSPAAVPPVERLGVDLGDGQRLSVLRWGGAEPEVVFLHGGAQNARTWDLVALALGRPALAIDLPGHGHSSWRADRDYGPVRNAGAVAIAMERHAPGARVVVGMSLGGLTTIRLAADRPDLVRRAVLVDVTPGSADAAARMSAAERGAVQLARGPRTFASLDEMVSAAVQASPRRPASAVRRGVVHNSRPLPDGTRAWRYDLPAPRSVADMTALWDDVDRMTMPAMLVKGGESGFVTAADLAEITRRLPELRVETVPGAGHAVQSDQPGALTGLIREFLFP